MHLPKVGRKCCTLITVDLIEMFFVGHKSDMVHREPGRDPMFPKHSLVVGSMWLADQPCAWLHVLHELCSRTSNTLKQAQLNKVCKWKVFLLRTILHSILYYIVCWFHRNPAESLIEFQLINYWPASHKFNGMKLLEKYLSLVAKKCNVPP